LLRISVQQPVSDVATIAMRQDCVEELLSSEALFFDVQHVLEAFKGINLPHVLARFVALPRNTTMEVISFYYHL
jgi:hypothetical protein